MTLDHHHPPHKLNVINFSAVSNLILTQLYRKVCRISSNINTNNMINNNNNNTNNKSNISSITDLILTTILIEGLWDKTTTTTTSTKTNISQLLLPQFQLNFKE